MVSFGGINPNSGARTITRRGSNHGFSSQRKEVFGEAGLTTAILRDDEFRKMGVVGSALGGNGATNSESSILVSEDRVETAQKSKVHTLHDDDTIASRRDSKAFKEFNSDFKKLNSCKSTVSFTYAVPSRGVQLGSSTTTSASDSQETSQQSSSTSSVTESQVLTPSQLRERRLQRMGLK